MAGCGPKGDNVIDKTFINVKPPPPPSRRRDNIYANAFSPSRDTGFPFLSHPIPSHPSSSVLIGNTSRYYSPPNALIKPIIRPINKKKRRKMAAPPPPPPGPPGLKDLFVKELQSFKSPPHKQVAPLPKVGEPAPTHDQLVLSREKPTIVVFLRHCGCPCMFRDPPAPPLPSPLCHRPPALPRT